MLVRDNLLIENSEATTRKAYQAPRQSVKGKFIKLSGCEN